MAKKVIGNLKLRIPGGKATAGPPVGSTLGQWGLTMMDFINPFNEKTKEYNGKKVSHNEGVGTTGKVFKTQSEALEYGNKEIERLVKEDKKPRQFSISKVSAEDGTLLGWTVDIFEDTSTKKDN